MKNLIVSLVFMLCCPGLTAQTTATFENYNLPIDTFLNGSDGNGGFSSGNIFLSNTYDPSIMFWSGWGISTTTDTTTPGFLNQSSAIAGGGYDGSNTYAVAYIFGRCVIHLEGAAAGATLEGMYVTNNTYTYLSMLEGDGFAKKFGGEFGDDPDFFLLTVKKYFDGELGTDSVNLYLADYRFEDNSEDYIVKDWTHLDLRSLGNADSLLLTLSSSDVGMFGMNTPAYFCIDHVTTDDKVVSVEEKKTEEPSFQVFPNPATDFIIVDWEETERSHLSIFDVFGREVKRFVVGRGQNRVDLSRLAEGTYFLQLKGKVTMGAEVVIKE